MFLGRLVFAEKLLSRSVDIFVAVADGIGEQVTTVVDESEVHAPSVDTYAHYTVA